MKEGQEIIIDFTPQGEAEGMHFDEFSLGFLGPMEVQRASEIVHNPKTQKWDIIIPGDKGPAAPWVSAFDGYDVARTFEVKWFQSARKMGVHPTSMDGLDIAFDLRCPEGAGELDDVFPCAYDDTDLGD